MADKNIDWELLRAEAKKAQKNAYANYSKFPVGAAALVDDVELFLAAMLKMHLMD